MEVLRDLGKKGALEEKGGSWGWGWGGGGGGFGGGGVVGGGLGGWGVLIEKRLRRGKKISRVRPVLIH